MVLMDGLRDHVIVPSRRTRCFPISPLPFRAPRRPRHRSRRDSTAILVMRCQRTRHGLAPSSRPPHRSLTARASFRKAKIPLAPPPPPTAFLFPFSDHDWRRSSQDYSGGFPTKAGVSCVKRAQRVNFLLLSIPDAVGCAQVVKGKVYVPQTHTYRVFFEREDTNQHKPRMVISPRPRYAGLHVRNPSEGTSGNVKGNGCRPKSTKPTRHVSHPLIRI